jgi:hypothetical protein
MPEARLEGSRMQFTASRTVFVKRKNTVCDNAIMLEQGLKTIRPEPPTLRENRIKQSFQVKTTSYLTMVSHSNRDFSNQAC